MLPVVVLRCARPSRSRAACVVFGVGRRASSVLPALIEALADEALMDGAPDGCVRRLVEAAVEHGRDRRREGAVIDDVVGDYYRLRTAIWLYLQDRPYPGEAVSRALLMIDRTITTATSASLVGFQRA